MQLWLLELYYELSRMEAGLKKHSVLVSDDQTTIFSYCEKGSKVPGQPSMVFIHGFSSSKEAWLPVIKEIPSGYHCIIIDLPGHGKTIGFNEEHYSIEKFVDSLKLFFDKMNLTEPMCVVGASIGSTIVAMFAVKYPAYVSMICLLALPANGKYESDLIRQLRLGDHSILLPETPEQFDTVRNVLMVQETSVPQTFVHGYFKSRLPMLDEQKKMLKAFFECDYSNLEQYYEQLKYMMIPTLIVWGREDQLCGVESADYFSKLISNSELIVFDKCGHFISHDKPKEVAKCIRKFYDFHSYCEILEEIEL